MGRFADLCGAIAVESEEGPDGLVVPDSARDRLRRENWLDADIDDALEVVHDNLLQSELFETADCLSAHLVELLGNYGGQTAFDDVAAHGATLPIDVLAQLVRRVTRLEEILEVYREGSRVDHRGFDELRRRLENYGIEDS